MDLKISDAEFECLEVIWEKGDWVSISELHGRLSQKKVRAYKTVGTFVIRLQEKGVLEAKKQGMVNYYRALIGRDQYLRTQTKAFLNNLHKGSKKSLISALFEESVSDEKLERLLSELEE